MAACNNTNSRHWILVLTGELIFCPTPSHRMNSFISLFSGAGGLDLGLQRVGWGCRYACDIDPVTVRTLSDNFSETKRSPRHSVPLVEVADVRDLEGCELLSRLQMKPGDVPLMAGGPPCQSWSSAGHQRGLDDPRGQLFRDFIRIADECGCRVILFENVRGILTARGPKGEPGGALRLIRETMWAHGYRSAVELINAADFGVPQRRVRLYLIGFRDTPAPVFPAPTHARQVSQEPLFASQHDLWVPMQSAILSLEDLRDDEFIAPSSKMAERLRGLLPGQGIKSAGKRETTRPGGHWGYMQGGFVADPSLPARTVTASAQQDWIRLCDGTFRRLCPRECARLQTFPEDWRFAGNRSAQYRQIGNAVAPAIASVLGRVIAEMLKSSRSTNEAFDPGHLPAHLASHVRYTCREDARNGASRRAAPNRRRIRNAKTEGS